MSEINCFAVERPWGRKERFIFWLFPKDYKALPKAPATHKDVLTVRTICVFGFIDRLRILISGRTFVETRTVCENEVGNNATAVSMFVLSPWDTDDYHD
jgi:hypothetical protein